MRIVAAAGYLQCKMRILRVAGSARMAHVAKLELFTCQRQRERGKVGDRCLVLVNSGVRSGTCDCSASNRLYEAK